MPPSTYDAIVLGLGGMGSAAAYHLARRGRRVLGLEQFWPAHDRGSSHGLSRIIRQAYFESPEYVPLVLRSYELWHELERESGTLGADRAGARHASPLLLQTTGGLMIGAEDSPVVRGSIHSAQTWHLPHRVLSAADLRREFPQFNVSGEIALYEDAAGALFPEDCILAHQALATRHGAELRFGATVEAWRPLDGGVEMTAAGERFTASALVVTAGAWAGRLLADLQLPLTPERNVICWFASGADEDLFAPGRFPVFIWDHPERPLYGLPNLRGEGAKVGLHHSGASVDPDRLDREVGPGDVEAIRGRLEQCMPSLDGELLRGAVCMYTNTPDEHFAIGLHPRLPHVAVAAGFSGHGFKFASVVGEILADLATDRTTHHPIAPFALDRFASTQRHAARPL